MPWDIHWRSYPWQLHHLELWVDEAMAGRCLVPNVPSVSSAGIKGSGSLGPMKQQALQNCFVLWSFWSGFNRCGAFNPLTWKCALRSLFEHLNFNFQECSNVEWFLACGLRHVFRDVSCNNSVHFLIISTSKRAPASFVRSLVS